MWGRAGCDGGSHRKVGNLLPNPCSCSPRELSGAAREESPLGNNTQLQLEEDALQKRLEETFLPTLLSHPAPVWQLLSALPAALFSASLI